MRNYEKRIASFEEEVQKMQKDKELNSKVILDAIVIEVDRLHRINENSSIPVVSEMRENAKAIAELGQTYAEIVRATQW